MLLVGRDYDRARGPWRGWSGRGGGGRVCVCWDGGALAVRWGEDERSHVNLTGEG
jgi:hypothetical protein